jgi:hypothetical protein
LTRIRTGGDSPQFYGEFRMWTLGIFPGCLNQREQFFDEQGISLLVACMYVGQWTPEYLETHSRTFAKQPCKIFGILRSILVRLDVLAEKTTNHLTF